MIGQAIRITRVLNELELKYVVAGGYPRDLVLDRESKDIDIIIYGSKAVLACDKLLTAFTTDFAVSDDDDYEGDRIAYVIKVGDVDIICYFAETEQEVFDTFDYNIN